MIHECLVTLPDGRTVLARVVATHEFDTNDTNIISCDLSWPNGEPLTADEYNEDLGGVYLHEFATDKALMTEP